MNTLIYILLLNSAFAASGKTKIFLKGSEGERLISVNDLTCADFNKSTQTATFRLKPEATARAKNFTEENRGIKANVMVCGTPFAFHLDSRLNDPGALVSVSAPKESQDCVSQAINSLPSCSQP